MKNFKKLFLILSCAVLMESTSYVNASGASCQSSTEVYTSEESATQEKSSVVEESYAKQSFLDLYQANALTFDAGITAAENADENGLMLSGPAETFQNSKITIARSFNFNGNCVSRISLDALAACGEDLIIYFYLDDETESFAEISLTQQDADSDWTKEICLDADVLAENIQGENHTLSFSVKNADEGGETQLFLRSIEFVESGLPTLYMNIDESQGTIDAMNQSEDHSANCYGSMTVEIPAGYTGEFGELADSATSEVSSDTYDLAYIHGRGNTTWSLDKKPYRIKLKDSVDLFGMGANKNWVLLANRYDNSKLRNQFSYWLGRELGMAYTPECLQVDLVMNGVYYGTYLLCEQVRVDENRVAIDDLEADDSAKNATDPSVITGGYLLSMEADSLEGLISEKTERGFSYTIESPSFDGYTNDAQLNYICDYMQKTEEAIYGDDFKDEDGLSYSEYMDVDSAIDYYWIQEFSKNNDAFNNDSTYLYKVRDGKLFWGPLWDFDSVAWDDNGITETGEFDKTNTIWFSRLLCDPEFVSQLTERWSKIKECLLAACQDGGQMDVYYEQILTSMRYDEEKWGFYYAKDMYDLGESEQDGANSTLYGEKERLKSWIVERVSWIDSNLASLQKETCKLTFMVDGEEYCTENLVVGDLLYNVPSAPEKDGYTFLGWIYQDSESGKDVTLNDLSNFTGDTVLNASYIADQEITHAQSLFLKNSECWIPLGQPADGSILDAEVFPADALGSMEYRSGDESILFFMEETVNVPVILGTGDVTVTVTFDGLQKDCLLHIYDPNETTIGTAGMAVSETELSLNIGEYQQLTITYNPGEHTNNNYEWTSDNSEVASVDSFGVVTANAAGKATIILTDLDTSQSTECKVTVSDK